MSIRKKAAIFDLDGTLVDSLADIANAANHALRELGFDPFTVEEYKTLAGGGNNKLMTRALRIRLGKEPDAELVRTGVTLKMGFQDGPSGHKNTKAFPGAHDMLKTLARCGILLAILSNKTEQSVRETVAETFPGIEWKHVAGARNDTPLKPDPTAALKIVTEYMPGIEPSECIFVGDTDIDMKTGKAAGMTSVGVPWGFRTAEELTANGATIVVSKPHDIAEFVIGT